MVAWGVVSTCTLFVQGAKSFYVFRFLLGIVESGFFPGVILYLTYWYTGKHRAQMMAIFMSAVPISGIFAGPLSGWILDRMTGIGSMVSWQWLFLVEGIPSILAGLITLRFLADNPSKARFLNDGEKKLVLKRLEEEEALKEKNSSDRHWFDAFRSAPIWQFSLAYFGLTAGNYGITFWLPQVIKETITQNTRYIGWISAIPWLVAGIAMFIFGRHSDATGERRWHMTLAAAMAAMALVASSFPGISGYAGLAFLTVAIACNMCGFVVFWSLPTAILSGTAAAAGIAWINSIGNLAGFVGPYAVGLIRDWTHSMVLALIVLAAVQFMTAIMTLYATRKKKAGAHGYQ
jgi:MFS family permease